MDTRLCADHYMSYHSPERHCDFLQVCWDQVRLHISLSRELSPEALVIFNAHVTVPN